jgi:hypothetical protein
MEQKEPVLVEEITDKLDRAKALAYVLADAAGGGVGVEDENVNHVCHMIVQEIERARELLESRESAKQSRKEAA